MARVGIAVALIPLVLAGLAVAGVTVPSPARSVFHSVGIDLPNQPSTDANSDSSQGSSEGTSQPASPSTSATGTSTGPSKGNSHAAHQHALSQRAKQKGKGKAIGHTRGKAVGLNQATPPGHSGQTGAPAHSNAGGNGGGSTGGNSASRVPKATHVPKGVAKGYTKVPPGRSK